MTRTTISNLLIVALILAISVFAGHGVYTFQKDVAAMRAASVEDITWTTSQLEVELNRFRETLLKFQQGDYGVTVEDVNTRFDIMWSRLALFQQGRVGERLAEYDSESMIAARLFSKVKELDRLVVELQPGDTDTAQFIITELESFPQELNDFTRFVTLGEETRGRSIREQLQAGVYRTVILSGIATLLALALVTHIYRQSLKFRQLAKVNRALADSAEKASRAKSQFLTMMSHELRTPMNAVLGMLALTREQSLQPSQTRLIENSEIAAKQMVGMLTDILDFSALQSEDLQLKSTVFELSHLVDAMRQEFAPLAQRENIDFSVEIDDGKSRLIKGDMGRLKQIFSHLTQYIVETAGTRETHLGFSYQDNNLIGRLSFEYSSDGGEWMPDLILGEESRSGEKFASDALGPAISRGLIEVMHGSIHLDNPDGNRISVIVNIPTVPFTPKHQYVAIFTESDAMAAICQAALKSENVTVLTPDSTESAHMVLIEAGGSLEVESLKIAKEKHPGAFLISLGNSTFADKYDVTFELPLDFRGVREILLKRIA